MSLNFYISKLDAFRWEAKATQKLSPKGAPSHTRVWFGKGPTPWKALANAMHEAQAAGYLSVVRYQTKELGWRATA